VVALAANTTWCQAPMLMVASTAWLLARSPEKSPRLVLAERVVSITARGDHLPSYTLKETERQGGGGGEEYQMTS